VQSAFEGRTTVVAGRHAQNGWTTGGHEITGALRTLHERSSRPETRRRTQAIQELSELANGFVQDPYRQISGLGAGPGQGGVDVVERGHRQTKRAFGGVAGGVEEWRR